MNWLDAVIIVVGVVLGLFGWLTGVLKALALVVGIGGGIALASRFNEPVAKLLQRWIENPDTATIVAFVIIVVLVLIAAVIASMLLRKVMEILVGGWLDRVAGLALGIFATFAIFSALLSAAQEYDVFGLPEVIAASALGSFVADRFDVLLRLVKLVPGEFGLP